MKRVISGLFLLLALGALGFILAGALKSGEQLIVRFLTAIIVAALGLYVISDLRLQADDSAVAKGEKPARGRSAPAASDLAGLQSTAAYMATVTRRAPVIDDPAPTSVTDLTADVLGLGGGAGARDATSFELAAYRAGAHSLGRPEVAKADERMLRASSRPIEAEIDDSLTPEYQLQDDEVRQWPLTAEHPVVRLPAPAGVDGSDGGAADAKPDRDRVDDDITRPLASRRLAAILAEADDEDDEDEAVATHRAPGAFDTGEIEKLVDQFAAGGPAPAPIGSSPFGRMPAPAGGLVLLERTPVDTTGPTSTLEAATPASFAPVTPRAPAPAPGAPRAFPSIGTPETPASGAAVAASAPLRPTRTTMPQPVSSTLAAADYTRAPLAGVVNLRPRPIAPRTEIEAAIRSGELEVIASLIDQGLLSAEGPISDRDVRTMVYVAFTSSELRKILLAGGTLDGDNSSIDLGEVDLFYQPALAGGSSLSQPPVEPAGAEPAMTPALPVEVIDLRDAEPARARAL